LPHITHSLLCTHQKVKDCGPSFTILSNGAVLHDVPGYHTADFVYPVGYKVLQAVPLIRSTCGGALQLSLFLIFRFSLHFFAVPGPAHLSLDERAIRCRRL